MADRVSSYKGTFIDSEIISVIPEALFDAHGFVEEMERKLIAESRREAEIVKRSFERVTKTWSADTKPTFVIRYGVRGDGYYLEVSTDSDIFRWLNFGTSVRYATMTPDFSPKTSVRVIGSKRGKGRLAFVNKNKPKEGIEAREWIDEVADRREDRYHANMEKVFYDVIDKYFMKGSG